MPRSMINVRVHVRNHMPQNMPRISRNVRRILDQMGRDAKTSAQRSIQHKAKPGAKGRPPRNVTGKLKAGIDYKVQDWVLSLLVHKVATNPPPGSIRRANVPKWLEQEHPYLRPAIQRILSRLNRYFGGYKLTR